MVSRTGKSTSHLYKAFETKVNNVESKVKAGMGQGSSSPTKLEKVSENSDDDEKTEDGDTIEPSSSILLSNVGQSNNEIEVKNEPDTLDYDLNATNVKLENDNDFQSLDIMSYHCQCLENLCRLCACKTDDNISAMDVFPEILILTNIDVFKDDPNIHPKKLCELCCDKLKSGEQFVAAEFKPHSDKCQICVPSLLWGRLGLTQGAT